MKVRKITSPHILALALSIAGCEYIGPQMHTKLPLPEIKPAIDDASAPPANPEEVKKTTKVEIISGIADLAPSKSFISSHNKATANGKGEYSLNFDDADLGEVSKVILSDILGKNYTISPQVVGKVTLQTTRPLSKEELLPTLDMLLNINNAAMVDQGGLYLIKPIADALYSAGLQTSNMPSGFQMRVIPVRNVAATEMAEILKPLLPEKAVLQVNPNANILLLAGSGSELSRSLDLVNIFDIDAMKGRSFALFTPANVDASVVIDELEQIFNNQPSSKSKSGNSNNGAANNTNNAKKEGDAPVSTASSSNRSFYRFLEIDRMNAILAITYNPQALKDVENWVIRLDKTNTESKGGVNVYRAQHHSATDLARTLSSIFGTGMQNNSSLAAGRSSLSGSNRTSTTGTGTGGMGGSTGGMGGSTGTGGMTSGYGGMGGMGGTSGGFGGSNQSAFSALGYSGTGLSTGMSGGGQPLMPNVKIIPDDTNNALIVVANAQEYTIIQRVIKQLDVLPLQVMIDATIVEVQLTNELQYGIEWFLSKNGNSSNYINALTGGANNSASPANTISSLASAAASGVGTGGFSYLFSNRNGNVSAVLQAAATNNNLNVISSPSLMVLNNQEAMITVGDSVPILSGTSVLTTGTAQSIQMVDTGVILNIKPRVNANGLVSMDLMQSVNDANTPAVGAAIQSPSITKRQIQTSIAVQSGETIVLGGLIKETDTHDQYGVPLLHEIPYIGPLFGSTTREKQKTELVVLLTPRVMKSRQDALDVTEEFKHKLTGIYDDKIPVSEVESEFRP